MTNQTKRSNSTKNPQADKKEIIFNPNTSIKDFSEDKATIGICFLPNAILGLYLPLAVVTAGIIITTMI